MPMHYSERAARVVARRGEAYGRACFRPLPLCAVWLPAVAILHIFDRRYEMRRNSCTSALIRQQALAVVIVIALVVPARTHLRSVFVAPRRNIRHSVRRSVVAIAY